MTNYNGQVIDGYHRTQAANKTRSEARLKPPTAKQLERVHELKNHPAFATGANLDWLVDAIETRNLLKNVGTIGILINEMKNKVAKYEQDTHSE